MATKPGRPHNFRALSKPKPLRKTDHRHYWPYIPVLLLMIATVLVSLYQPAQKRGVLAYATSISPTALLQATNTQRNENKVASLRMSDELTAAAQAKANDMITRNYWSHNTPDGKEPWVFINATDYKYQKAGENLAYGFATSNDTITGWMNSPPHRENLLDKDFVEVGFGFANGSNYNNSGHETVVVAMYARPQILAADQAAPATPLPVTNGVSGAQSQASPVTTAQPIVAEPVAKPVTRIETLTGGKAPWLTFGVGLVTGIALVMLLVKHMAGLRHVIKNGERFMLKHPVLDTTLMSLVLLGAFLSQTSGFIR